MRLHIVKYVTHHPSFRTLLRCSRLRKGHRACLSPSLYGTYILLHTGKKLQQIAPGSDLSSFFKVSVSLSLRGLVDGRDQAQRDDLILAVDDLDFDLGLGLGRQHGVQHHGEGMLRLQWLDEVHADVVDLGVEVAVL